MGKRKHLTNSEIETIKNICKINTGLDCDITTQEWSYRQYHGDIVAKVIVGLKRADTGHPLDIKAMVLTSGDDVTQFESYVEIIR